MKARPNAAAKPAPILKRYDPLGRGLSERVDTIGAGVEGGRTRRLNSEILPLSLLVDRSLVDVADFAHAAEVAVGVVALDLPAADVAGVDHITRGDIGGRAVGAVVGSGADQRTGGDSKADARTPAETFLRERLRARGRSNEAGGECQRSERSSSSLGERVHDTIPSLFLV